MAFVTLESDEELEVRKKRIKDLPSYSKIGNGKMNHKIGTRSIDLLEEVGNMSADEKYCFFKIKDGIQWSIFDKRYIYQVRINQKEWTQSQKNMFSRGFKKLKSKDLVRRVKNGVYMISPLALVPTEFDAEYKIWNQL